MAWTIASRAAVFLEERFGDLIDASTPISMLRPLVVVTINDGGLKSPFSRPTRAEEQPLAGQHELTAEDAPAVN